MLVETSTKPGRASDLHHGQSANLFMNAGVAFVPIWFLASLAFLAYGPVQDHSEFVSARLADAQQGVLFTFHRFAYRPATGWRAFPDGGIPDYVEDVNILAAYDLPRKKVKMYRREKNFAWQPGSGLFTIHAISGNKALIAQGGQLRGDFKLTIRYIMLDLKSGNCQDLDLKSDLAKYGRDCGQIYLVDTNGTLVFITLSLDEAKDPSANRNSTLVPEIWVRDSKGSYRKVATSAHYECTRNGEVIYWESSTRTFMAFSLTTSQTRPAPEFKVRSFEDVTQGAGLTNDRRGIEIGEKVAGQWNYHPLDLKPETLR